MRRFGLTDNKPISIQKFVQLLRADVVGAVETDVEVTDGAKKIAPPQTLSRGRGRAKTYSAGDGRYHYLQTQFGEDRYTQFRVIMVTDPQTNTPTNTHTHKHTHPQTHTHKPTTVLLSRPFLGLETETETWTK